MTVAALPPPHDLDAERTVISAVLCGEVRAVDLQLPSAAFWWELHACIWRVLLLARRPEPTLYQDRALAVLGGTVARIPEAHTQRDDVLRQLLHIRDEVPFTTKLLDAARRVWVLRRQRQTIAAMHRIEAAWRNGDDPAPELLRWTARRLAAQNGGDK